MDTNSAAAKVIADLAGDPETTVDELAEAADRFGFDPLEVLAQV